MISIDKKYANLKPKDFKAWHNKYFSHDEKTWEERYVEIGGKVPKKKED